MKEVRQKSQEIDFLNLFESAADAIVVVDLKGDIQFVNEQVTNWFGYSREELIAKPIEILVPNNIAINSYLKQPVKLPIDWTRVELKGKRKDGSEFPVDIALSPSGSGEERVVTAIIRDMSVKNKQDRQMRFLAKASELLANSLENEDTLEEMADLVVAELADACEVRLIDDDGNLYLKTISHRDHEKEIRLEALSRSFEAKHIQASEFSEALRTNEVQFRRAQVEFNTQLPDLEPWEKKELDYISSCHSVIIPIYFGGKTLGVLSYLLTENEDRYDENDIIFLQSIATRVALSLENSRLFKQAQLAIKVREDILAIVTHDLKNPLSTIQLINQMLSKTNADEQEKMVNLVSMLQDSTDQMERIISDLMDFSKIQEGKFTIKKEVENPHETITLIMTVLDLKAKAKGLVLTSDVNADIGSHTYDKYRILQALYNLVGNAIKFTPRNGKIHLSVKKSERGVTFSVADTGPGIDEKNLTNVFDRFWQAQRTDSFSAGLGLSITKGIIESHNGKIWVQSKIGQGSTFYFELP